MLHSGESMRRRLLVSWSPEKLWVQRVKEQETKEDGMRREEEDKEIDLQYCYAPFFICSIILSHSRVYWAPVFFPMLPVIPTECPFWPPQSAVLGAACWRWVVVDYTDRWALRCWLMRLMGLNRNASRRLDTPCLLNSGEISPTVGYFSFSPCVGAFLRCWHSRPNCLECCF